MLHQQITVISLYYTCSSCHPSVWYTLYTICSVCITILYSVYYTTQLYIQNTFCVLYIFFFMFNKHTHTCKCLLMHIHTQSSIIGTHHSSTHTPLAHICIPPVLTRSGTCAHTHINIHIHVFMIQTI